jgi:hypothetical protein
LPRTVKGHAPFPQSNWIDNYLLTRSKDDLFSAHVLQSCHMTRNEQTQLSK